MVKGPLNKELLSQLLFVSRITAITMEAKGSTLAPVALMLSVRAGGGNELVKFVDVNTFHLFHLAVSREACEKLQMGIISSPPVPGLRVAGSYPSGEQALFCVLERCRHISPRSTAPGGT